MLFVLFKEFAEVAPLRQDPGASLNAYFGGLVEPSRGPHRLQQAMSYGRLITDRQSKYLVAICISVQMQLLFLYIEMNLDWLE